MRDNGNAPLRVDMSIRVVLNADSYEFVGEKMDAIVAALRAVLPKEAAFDFTSFQTYPCKAIEMERAYHNESRAERDPEANWGIGAPHEIPM